MRTAWIIAQREYKRYFSTPAAYVFSCLIFLLLGAWFYAQVWFASQPPPPGSPPIVPNVQMIIAPLVVFLWLVTPAITTHLLAGEQRMGTIELMLTAPVRDGELVVGKWLGGFLFMLTIVALSLIYPVILNQMVEPGIDQGPLVAGYLGLILVCAAQIAVGVAISSLFSNQTASFITTLFVFLFLWLIVGSLSQIGGATGGGELMRYLDFSGHFYQNFFRGVIDLIDVLFYVSTTALALFVGTVMLETRRWR